LQQQALANPIIQQIESEQQLEAAEEAKEQAEAEAQPQTNATATAASSVNMTAPLTPEPALGQSSASGSSGNDGTAIEAQEERQSIRMNRNERPYTPAMMDLGSEDTGGGAPTVNEDNNDLFDFDDGSGSNDAGNGNPASSWYNPALDPNAQFGNYYSSQPNGIFGTATGAGNTGGMVAVRIRAR
jgi:hypothetical protein